MSVCLPSLAYDIPSHVVLKKKLITQLLLHYALPDNAHSTPTHTSLTLASGYSDGYPLLLSGNLNAGRAMQSLQYIKDGDYLNSELTSSLSLQVRINTRSEVHGV